LSTNILKLNDEKLEISDFDNKEMVFQEGRDFSDETLLKIFAEIKQAHAGKRIHFMASQKKKGGGVEQLNKILQDIYNSDAHILIPGRYDEYREGDKIIRTENDYTGDRMRVNGDRATLVIDTKCKGNQVCVQYDDDNERQIMSTRDFWDNFKHFYASTVHKMQGSETDVIVLVMPFVHNFMWTMTADSKKLLYTAISRCKEKCIIIGSSSLFMKAQNPKLDNSISLFMKEFKTWELD
jgi:exodeoxyribonuclease V alpha subunit